MNAAGHKSRSVFDRHRNVSPADLQSVACKPNAAVGHTPELGLKPVLQVPRIPSADDSRRG